MIVLPDLVGYVEKVATPLLWLLIAALLDLLFGVLLAVVRKRFDWELLTDYLSSTGLPILAWLIAEFLLLMPSELVPESMAAVFNGMGYVIYGTVMLKVLASLLGHFSSLGVLTGIFDKVGVVPTDKRVEE